VDTRRSCIFWKLDHEIRVTSLMRRECIDVDDVGEWGHIRVEASEPCRHMGRRRATSGLASDVPHGMSNAW
jgi:hypothetical protein